MRFWAVVPAFNEAPRIAAVVADLRARGLQVLVVDDGSSDGTADIARAAGAEVLRCPSNRGKGQAILTACAWAVQQAQPRILLCDGDGQHDPADAWRLLAAALRFDCDLVIGARTIDIAQQPALRRVANRCASMLISIVSGRRIHDSQCGYRVCRPQQVLAMALRSRRYDLESEWCLRAARSRQRIVEIPVRTKYGDKISGMHPLHDTRRFLTVLATTVGGFSAR